MTAAPPSLPARSQHSTHSTAHHRNTLTPGQPANKPAKMAGDSYNSSAALGGLAAAAVATAAAVAVALIATRAERRGVKPPHKQRKEHCTRRSPSSHHTPDQPCATAADAAAMTANAAARRGGDMEEASNDDRVTQLWSTLNARIGLSRTDEQALPAHDRGRCKNLLVRDKNGFLFLLVTAEDAKIDFPHVRRQIHAKRSLSMVAAARLPSILGGARRGCLSPFTLARPGSIAGVTVVLDERLLGATSCLWHVSDDPASAVRADIADVVRFCELHGIRHCATSFLRRCGATEGQ